MTKLNCKVCNFSTDVPTHCGKEMHTEEVNNEEMLVCWMGPGCGKQSIPIHHDMPLFIE